MFESITRAVSAHKHMVIAGIALTALISYLGPIPDAMAQGLGGIGIDVTPGGDISIDLGEYGFIGVDGGITIDLPGLNGFPGGFLP